MDPDFWHDKWQKNQIGFHQENGNPLLQKHLCALGLTKGARIFLPLCGKTGDIAWLLSQGFRVVGAELNHSAIEQLFDHLQIPAEIKDTGPLTHYHAPNIDIFAGDIFDLTQQQLGPVDAIYDRAAYVALPNDMRLQYAGQMPQITESAPQLLITFEYDPSTVSGPPHAITTAELQDNYGAQYHLNQLEVRTPPDGIKGVSPATESIWHLVERDT